MTTTASRLKPPTSQRATTVGRERTQEPDPTTPEGQWALYLCKLMDDRGISADALAESAEVARSLIFKYRRGETVPSIRVWGRFAAALGLSDWRALVPPDSFVKSLKKKR